MQDITIKVPDERVPEFYEFFGKWLGGRLDTTQNPSTNGSDIPTEPWSEGDLELAKQVWGRLSDRAKGLFIVLADHAESRFSAIQLAEQLEIPHGRAGVAGTLAWPGRHCIAVGRKLPVSYRELEDDSEYWMTDDVAALFRAARDAAGGAS
jgi:hypothetical protein